MTAISNIQFSNAVIDLYFRQFYEITLRNNALDLPPCSAKSSIVQSFSNRHPILVMDWAHSIYYDIFQYDVSTHYSSNIFAL